MLDIIVAPNETWLRGISFEPFKLLGNNVLSRIVTNFHKGLVFGFSTGEEQSILNWYFHFGYINIHLFCNILAEHEFT